MSGGGIGNGLWLGSRWRERIPELLHRAGLVAFRDSPLVPWMEKESSPWAFRRWWMGRNRGRILSDLVGIRDRLAQDDRLRLRLMGRGMRLRLLGWGVREGLAGREMGAGLVGERGILCSRRAWN